MNRTLTVGRMLLLTLILALGIFSGTQAVAACSDAAERYPMLIGSGYEGEPCEFADTACPGNAERYLMLIGSGYEGEPCGSTLARAPIDSATGSTSSDWHETMLNGSGYERAVIEAALARRD